MYLRIIIDFVQCGLAALVRFLAGDWPDPHRHLHWDHLPLGHSGKSGRKGESEV